MGVSTSQAVQQWVIDEINNNSSATRASNTRTNDKDKMMRVGSEEIPPVENVVPPPPPEAPPKLRNNSSYYQYQPPPQVKEEEARFEDLYRLGHVLGSGAFGTVYSCVNKKQGQEYAVKVIDREELDPKDERQIREEVSIMQSLDHPHIVRCVGFFTTPKHFKIVQELCRGGELFDRMSIKGVYEEQEAKVLSCKLLEAVDFYHSRHIVHRDLKPENILLVDKKDDVNIKVADFGGSRRVQTLEADKWQTRFGSPGYAAPEVLNGDKYNEKVDMWACGVIIFGLLAGSNPFASDTMPAMFNKIRHADYHFCSAFNNVSEEGKDLIRQLLTVDPHKRITAKVALEHKWFKASSPTAVTAPVTVAA